MDKDSLRSPIIPQTPAPAYTPLPHTSSTYHSAPLLNGGMGDIELETVDGKRFLVHKSVLEAETVFFHIYYGFVPVWRLNGTAPAPYHTSAPTSTLQPQSSIPQQGLNLNLNANFGGLASLRKIITSTLAPVSGPSSSSSRSNSPAPPPFSAHGAVPPPPMAMGNCGPKMNDPVTAPTPTASPFTWLVPESSTVLSAFLTLIYPTNTIQSVSMDTIDTTGRVIRAALGYQSTKALTLARDHLSRRDWLESQPLEVYSMACFFKFSDLAKFSSGLAVRVPMEEWHNHRTVMGRTGMEKLHELHDVRLEGLFEILDRSLTFDASFARASGEAAGNESQGGDEGMCGGGHTCEDTSRMRQMWSSKVDLLKTNLGAGSELLELLEVDLRGGWCEGCLVMLGRNIQWCIVQARGLPQSI